MSHISFAWSQAIHTIDTQLKSFNKTPLLTPDKVKSIQDVVSAEIERMQILRIQMEKRQKELNRACSPRLNSMRALWIATIGVGISSACGVTATYFTLFGENALAKTTACALASLSIVANFGATFYVNKIALINQESAQLAALQDKGEEHAIKFKDFLDKLYLILLQERHKEPSRTIDTEIITCLQYYEQLPSSYKSDKGFASTVSSLVQALPQTDPLRQEFATLDAHRFQKVASSARKEEEVRVHYLPLRLEIEKPQGEGVEFFDKKDFKQESSNWLPGEETGASTSGVHSDSLPLGSISDYSDKLETLKTKIASRFQIKHPIPYLISGVGCRLDSQRNTPAPSKRTLGAIVAQMEDIV